MKRKNRFCFAALPVLALALILGACPTEAAEDDPDLTGTVAITGTPWVGETLTADTSALGGTGAVSYQWLRGTAPIEGAADSRYVPVDADIDQILAVQVSRAGHRGTVSGSAAEAVLGAGSFNSVAELASLASAQGGGSPQSLFAARLGSGIDIANNWGEVNTAVQSAQKYVLLDLRNCAVTGGEISGTNVTPAGNRFNIIRDNPYIKHIMLPETLVSISSYAFYQCTALTGLTMPETVTDIGLSAFEGCTSLVSVDIPDSVLALGSAVFRGCARLEEVSGLPVIAALPADLFMYCVSLTGVTIPEGTLIIGSRTFYGCESLTHIALPDSLTSIAPRAFYGAGITSIAIPDSVTKIEDLAFYQCSGLTSVRVPGTVSSLGTAFQECARLEEVIFGARSAPLTVASNTFLNCRSLRRVVFEDANINWADISNAFPAGSQSLKDAYTAGGPGIYELAGTQWYKRG